MLRQILNEMSKGNFTVDGICAKLGMQKSALQDAIRMLERMGCLDKQWQSCRQACGQGCGGCPKAPAFFSLSEKGRKYLEKD
jgi:hypothetical protein